MCQERGAKRMSKGAKNRATKLKFNPRSKKPENALNNQLSSEPYQLDEFKFQISNVGTQNNRLGARANQLEH